jgi:8-oxo-dGTP pyrophosphatase MutT (NUDIX family)
VNEKLEFDKFVRFDWRMGNFVECHAALLAKATRVPERSSESSTRSAGLPEGQDRYDRHEPVVPVVPDFSSLKSVELFLHARLRQPLPGADAHHRFAPRPLLAGWRPDDLPSHARRAATLILLYPGEHGVTFPLTVRHSALPHHPGQISLPGGRIDVDESGEHAALRETHEEIGVPRDTVRVLGPLSTLWVVVSNHVVQPFVAVTDTRPVFQPDAREVEHLIEMPLSALHDEAVIGSELRMRDHIAVEVPCFTWHDQQIWGATAMILAELAALFEPSQLGTPAKGERVKG